LTRNEAFLHRKRLVSGAEMNLIRCPKENGGRTRGALNKKLNKTTIYKISIAILRLSDLGARFLPFPLLCSFDMDVKAPTRTVW
jgi:hypothetical protein